MPKKKEVNKMTTEARRIQLENLKRKIICGIGTVAAIGLFLYAGRADFNIETGRYTMKGVANGNQIVTENGESWECDTYFDKETVVVFTVDGNHTFDTWDDEIVEVHKSFF